MPRLAQDGPARLFDVPGFEGFGPSRFHPGGEHLGGFCIRGRRSTQLKKGVVEHAPKRPGVYVMLDPRGRIIYVGKAKCLRTRLCSYFRVESRDPKAGRIVRHTRTLLWEHCADELAALLRELELIQRHRPRFNVLGLPGLRRYCYIALGRPEAPYLYLTREPSKKDVAVYGPFVGRDKVDAAIRRLNDAFGLRDCNAGFPMAFADEKPLFDSDKSAGCLRYELGTCLGPCGGGCTRRKYRSAVKDVQEYLDGADHSILAEFEKRMAETSKLMQFERAATLRDKIADLEWLNLRLALLRRSRHETAFVYPVAASGRGLWYLLNRGRVWGTIWEPVTREETLAAIATLKRMTAETLASPVTVTSVDSVLLLLAWFRKRSEEKSKLQHAESVIERLRTSLAHAA